MTDIVERLRALSSQGDPTIENEAADRIVLLEGQLAVAAAEIERQTRRIDQLEFIIADMTRRRAERKE